jgi:TRAP-type C4-dicarboxylate transport system substrate-binding protein
VNHAGLSPFLVYRGIMKKWLFYLIVLIFICFVITQGSIGKTVITVGTMAPRESIWGQIFIEINADLIKESDGQLELRPFFNRAEQQLVELIKTGRSDAVSLTGSGLGNILPEAFIFPLPLLFSTYEELDYVRGKLAQRFEQLLEKKGYVLLGWADFGFVYLFSKIPIKTQTDFQDTRFWAWDLDPVAKEFVSASGREPIVLPIQSVLSSLKEDHVQTVYNSPLACIALGWHTQVKYMSDFPLAAGIGATVISRRKYDGLSDEHKRLLREIARKHHEQLIRTARSKSEESIDVLKEQGIEVISIPPGEREKWSKVARQVQDQFVGKLYKKDLLDKVRSLLSEYKANRF